MLRFALSSLAFSLPAVAETTAVPPELPTPTLALRLETRVRYVSIDEADKPLRVDVTTVRVIAGADVVLAPTLRLTAELIHSDFIPPKRFNDNAAAFASPYPLLPDPRYSGVNELHLTWNPVEDWLLRLGRQGVKLGNERHISDDAFRQVPLLYDGLFVRGAPIERAQLTLGQFNRLRLRNGATESLQLTLMEWAMNPWRDVSVATYAIRHRPQAQASSRFRFGVADLSNQVVGAVVDGSAGFGETRGYYTLNVADQRSTGDESALRARYWRAGAGAGWRGWVLRADHEVKGSNGGRYGFQTPLTNQYAFNGNSLTFFDTPTAGLRDSWATLRWEQGAWSVLGEYHRFRSDFGNRRYGQELDLNLTYTVNPHTYVRAQWARYRPTAGGFGTDIDKIWLTVGYELK